MSLAVTAIRGAYFTGIALALRQIISFATTLYIARLLHPEDFGIVSMVMVVIGFAQVIGDVGISAGLVRTQKNSPKELSTCFWIGLGIGIVLAICVFLSAPLAAKFYGIAQIESLLQISSLGLIISFCLPVPLAVLQQRLGYREIAVSQATGSLSGAAAAMILVTAGSGIWGLVLQPIIGNVVSLVMMATLAKWHPTREYDYRAVREILHDGVNLLGAGLTQFARNNFDTVVIGKALQAKDLGVYGLAQTILYAPMYLITSVISRVLFPLLAKVQGDSERIADAVLTASSRTALLTFPLYLGLFVVAEDAVALTFGKSWGDLIPLIRIMTIAFLIQSVSSVASPVMIALGKSKLLLRISIAGAFVYFTILLFAIRYGITFAAIGYTLANSLIGIATLGVALKAANISLLKYFRAISRPFFLAFLMAILIPFINLLVTSGTWINLSLSICTGVLIYAYLIYIFEKDAWQQVLVAIRRQTSKQ